MLSCFPFPDIFVKSVSRDASISHTDLHSKQLDLCFYCVITKMNHCHVSSKAWQDGDFSAGKCQLNPAPTALMTPTAYLVFITEKKNIQQKRLSFEFYSLPGKTWEQVKHSSESSNFLNSRDNKNSQKNFHQSLLKNRIKMLDKNVCVHTRTNSYIARI